MASVPVPSGPAWPTRSLLVFCRLLPLDCPREKKKLDLHVKTDFYYYYFFLPSPFSPFLYSHGPQTSLETEPASCECRPASISLQHPPNLVTKVFSKIFPGWGSLLTAVGEAACGDAVALLPFLQPRPLGLASGLPALPESTLATPALTSSLPATPGPRTRVRA